MHFVTIFALEVAGLPTTALSVQCIPPCIQLLYSKTGIYLLFILLQNIDCGYFLELPRQGGSNMYPQSLFLATMKKESISKAY